MRDGEWVRVRSGAYIAGPTPSDRFAARDLAAMARVTALSRQLTTRFAFSHSSAALIWGLPSWDTETRAHITQPAETRGPDRDLVRHVRHLPADECTNVAGLPVTTLERTLVDCAMTVPPRWGLVLADAGLRAGAERAACQAICAGLAGRRGIVMARAVIELANDGAESPGESSTRFTFLRAGFPVPRTQIEVPTHLGVFWSDLGWPEWALLAEYDGRTKYGAAGTAVDAVVAEKRRQDAIEEAGRRVLRITSADLRNDAALVRRVLRFAPPGTAELLEPRRALTTRVKPVRPR